ncbi:MAG: tripartite tricarboxylate transporter TctB family protein [Clostridium sp.]|nr:tripartite tricarboxylate transporter TctB family protein [Clostridium sp.]
MAGDIAVCALLLLFCLFCLFNLMFGMGNVMEYDPMGPRAWPVFLLALLIALLSVNIFLTVRAGRRSAAAGESIEAGNAAENVKPYKLAWSAAGLFVYIPLMDKIGFVCSTPLFVGYYMTLLGNRSRKARLMAAVLSTAALYILFSRFLQVPLPRGYGMFRDLSLFFETL